MASWNVAFVSGPDRTEVDLIDTFGFNNEWQAADAAALIPAKGYFTNQTNNVVPTVQPTWILKAFDIDKVSVGDTGEGDMRDNDGAFPTGLFEWQVLKKL